MFTRSLRFALLISVFFLMSGLPAQAQFLWRVVKHEGRDYLPLDNVAQFYQLQFNPRTVSNPLTLSGPRAQVEVSGDARELVVNGVKQWLSFPMLIESGQVLISRFDLAKMLDPVLRPNMVPELRPFKTVVLDAGHGGQDRGASSTTGLEKDYTLSVIQNVKRLLLAKGYQVKMTRDSDVFIPLEGRADQANVEKDAIFVSVHFNSSSDNGAASGFEVFAMTPRGALSTGDAVPTLDVLKELPGNLVDNASLALATCVHHSLLGHIPQVDRGVKRARFVVLKMNRLPAILVEGGFLTNPSESQRINETEWREKLAASIVDGVESYKQVADRRVMPRLLADYRLEQLPLSGRMVDPNAIVPVQSSPGVMPTSNVVDLNSPSPLTPSTSGQQPAPEVKPSAAAPPMPEASPKPPEMPPVV